MNDEPMMVDETEDFGQPRRSPRRSWRLFQWVVAGLATLLIAGIVTTHHWGNTFGGATKSKIAEFEQAMTEYFDEAESRNLSQVTMASYNPLRTDEYSEAVEREKGTYDARERVRKLADSMNFINSEKAQAQFLFRAYTYNGSGIPDVTFQKAAAAESEPWVMRSVMAGIWLAIKTAVITFVASWLVLKLCELFWWFFIDRLRDVADAVRKS
jgi:hypothetical protein